MKVIQAENREAAYNLALEEYVLRNFRDDDYLILWVNNPCIVVGKFQNVYQEIHIKRAYEQGIPVYRRISGGGCVYHDQGNLNFTFITDWDADRHDYAWFLNPVMHMLGRHQITASMSGICNLVVGDKKISGSAQTIIRNRILHHGTLLWDTDLEKLNQLLKSDYQHYKSKAVRSAPCEVMNLNECGSKTLRHMGELKEAFMDYFSIRQNDMIVLTREQEQAVEKLKREKYYQWEWNYGQFSDFTYTKEIGGSPEETVSYKVEAGRLKDVGICSKLLPENMCRDIEMRLCNEKYTYENLKYILDRIAASNQLSDRALLDQYFF